ncbi:hypothetical protein [Polynucleobacter antarcticus]|uniref:Uncharacterized protein n=1 Tax=Polynucleobacter antarcticus TaxID=1743162 RepID=A0A6M9PS36_9BURK|nr:hypothetical protein [Polynucleobacter antarcticus]QKM62682.1 hypothetical protein DCO16_06205 [Polynucleobacter antarcticus]
MDTNNFREKITVVATDDEMEDREEIRLGLLIKQDIAFPEDWERKKSKALSLDFMRMSEKRSYLDH